MTRQDIAVTVFAALYADLRRSTNPRDIVKEAYKYADLLMEMGGPAYDQKDATQAWTTQETPPVEG